VLDDDPLVFPIHKNMKKGTRISIRATKPGAVGASVVYVIGENRIAHKKEKCLSARTGKPRPCPPDT
jgi:hypothetical protein